MGTELVRAEGGEVPHEAAKRRAGSGNDDDGIGSGGHGGDSCGIELDYDNHIMQRKNATHASHDKLS
jgi:hypothetical protein